jgi:D-alanyl-D-alanine carboxypeptidase/D-alanyl-D-alanine-endopeptidase (penicillin-binding protein 4)
VVVDATRFDKDGLPPGFDQKDEFASYRAPLGASSVNFNTYVVVVHPGDAAGSPAEVMVNPPVSSFQVVNKVTTAQGVRNRVAVSIDDDGPKTKITVSGSIGVDAARGSYRYPVKDPSRYAGEVFALALRQAGVRLGRSKVSSDELPNRVERFGVHRSPTLGVLIRSVNKLSNNFMAEQILRTLGGDDAATAAASLERLREWTREIEIPQTGLSLGNGSGLYDNNRISAAQMTQMLARMYADFRYRADYLASFAVMGVDGTTRRRLDESPARRWIRAKTGTLDGVSALSGYAGAEGRAPIAFSILMNDLGRWETGAARRVQNEIAEMLALELVRPTRD